MRNRSITALHVCLAALLFGSGGIHAAEDVRLATTTSTENSGLLKYLLPKFEENYGGKVRVVAVGTGASLKLGENCDADVVLVHARAAEDKFMEAGFGSVRKDVMYNDFIIVGPKNDPAKVRGSKDVIAAMKKIAASGAKFVSRGDESGTHKMEGNYWKAAGVKPEGAAYIAAGQGMGPVLTMAGELHGYTLTDRATFGAYAGKTGLETLVEGDPEMFNPYGVIAVNPEKCPNVNKQGAMALVDWITSDATQKAIADFEVDGKQVFFPSAKK